MELDEIKKAFISRCHQFIHRLLAVERKRQSEYEQSVHFFRLPLFNSLGPFGSGKGRERRTPERNGTEGKTPSQRRFVPFHLITSDKRKERVN